MSRSKLLLWLGCALCAGWLLLPGQPAWCADAWGEPSEVEKKIEEALREPTQLKFLETPLSDVVEYLKDFHDIEIQIDTRALHDLGIADDTPITKSLKGIALRSALNLMLREVEMAYTVTDEVLLITSRQQAANTYYPRVYTVADLIEDDGEGELAAQNCQVLEELLEWIIERGSRRPPIERGRGRPVGEFVIPPRAPGAPEGPIAPRRRSVPRRGDIVPIPPERPRALVVVQNRQGHERVAEVLQMLRQAADQDPKSDPVPIRRVPAAEKKIAAALKAPTHLEVIKTPLQDVVDYLKSLHHIEIQIDTRSLEDVGIGTDTPITRNLKGISLHALLRLILRELDLTYVIENEVLLIITPEEAGRRLYPRVYPLGHLIAGPDEPEAEREFGLVRDLIVSVAEPVTWDEVGGPGSIVGDIPALPSAALVIQDRVTHAEIEQLLALLHQAAKAGPRSGPIPVDAAGPVEQKIRKALNSPAELDCVEVPLQDVVDYFRHKHGIEIQIDHRALEDAGVPATAITRRLKGVLLRSALHLVLRELGLTFVIRDEVLLITTPEEAETRLQTVFYPMGGLFPRDCDDPKDRAAYGAKLAKTITRLAAPATWDKQGGPGAAAPLCTRSLDLLVVSQTEDVHKQVAGLLARPEFRQPARRGAAPSQND